MVGAALSVGLDASWVTGNEVYGLEAHRLGYVLVIAANRRVSVQGAERTATEAAALLAAP
ncbi:hypothetical protein [Streptosporangium saharense]|uniref:hypothetical protein n=1 Tax=Streptosporangium saharense TaxID=1706840 RepID=UPI003317280B